MSAAPSAAASFPARRLFALLAYTTLVLTFVVIAASAFMRHTQAGLGCADWPSCYARVVAEAPPTSPTTGVYIARALHRLAASSALLLMIGMLLLARSAQNYGRERTLALAALVIALGLAALGIVTPDAVFPAIPLGNLIGGYSLIAVLAALAGSTASGGDNAASGTSPRLRAVALALLAAVVVQAVIGGLIGAQFALRACPTLDDCAPISDAFARGAALDPFRKPVVVSGHVVPPPGAGGLHSMHRMLGIAIALAGLTLAFGLRRSHRRSALSLAGLSVAAPLLGASAILGMPALTVTVLHNAAAAALIATLAHIVALREPRAGVRQVSATHLRSA